MSRQCSLARLLTFGGFGVAGWGVWDVRGGRRQDHCEAGAAGPQDQHAPGFGGGVPRSRVRGRGEAGGGLLHPFVPRGCCVNRRTRLLDTICRPAFRALQNGRGWKLEHAAALPSPSPGDAAGIRGGCPEADLPVTRTSSRSRPRRGRWAAAAHRCQARLYRQAVRRHRRREDRQAAGGSDQSEQGRRRPGPLLA